jgi:hypothetical protein
MRVPVSRVPISLAAAATLAAASVLAARRSRDDIRGEVAIVTGASRGLGLLLAREPCGPSPDEHIKGIRAYTDAGFDEVYAALILGRRGRR